MHARFLFTRRKTINRLLKKKPGTQIRCNPLVSTEEHTPATQTGNSTPAENEIYQEENGKALAAASLDLDTNPLPTPTGVSKWRRQRV